MLNSYDLADRQVIAAVHEYNALHRRRYTIIKLDQPIQRGWRRFYVLGERAMARRDRPMLEAILAVIGPVVVHHNRDFRSRNGRRRKLVEIEQPLRPVPTYEWMRKNYPAEWHRYFRYELVLERNRHWQPYWVFTQPSLYEFKIERNWLWHFREVDPAIETRLSELDGWLEARQGWPRYGWLKGRRQRYRWKDEDTAKQRSLEREHRCDISSACENFPEVDPAASTRRIRLSLPRIGFASHTVFVRRMTGNQCGCPGGDCVSIGARLPVPLIHTISPGDIRRHHTSHRKEIPMQSNEVHQRVRDALAQVEAERNVRVLFACESGSRAWGFASRDSDYDVRFLYVQRRDWYLSVEDRRDVIEYPLDDELDVSGWELRKALRLLRKSNPPLLEWLKSPVVYRHDPVFAAEFGALAAEFYSPRRCFAHYLHMAFGNWRQYLQGREEVSLKKYLYVFRPLLACRWIERQSGQVPMLFAQLVESVLDEAGVRVALAELVARKQSGEELAVAPPVAVLSRFVEAELPRLEALNEPEDARGDVEELNGFFRRYALAV